MNTVEKGQRGEETALNYLYTKGLKLIARNWRCGHHEIDLIMEDEFFIRIIEIRSLTFPNIIEPKMTIGKQKQKGLIIAANTFAKINQIKKEIVFDVVSIIFHHKEYKIDYIKNAFSPIWNTK